MVQDTTENYSLYFDTVLELRDALLEDGLLSDTPIDAEERATQRALEEAAQSEGREADFTEVLLAFAQHQQRQSND